MLFRYLRSNFLFWFGGIFTLVGLIVLAVAVYVANKIATRKIGYYQVAATITGKHIFRGIANGDTNYLDLRYDDRNGQSHKASVNTSTKKYNQAKPGEPFPVNVSTVDPNDAWPTDQATTHLLTAAAAFLGLCFFVPGIIFAGTQLRRILRSVTTLRRGQYIVGRVENIVSTKEKVNGRRLYRISWSWQGLDGKRRRAESPALSKTDASHWKPGDEIAAYIHPSNPEFAEADVYGFRAKQQAAL
jgi:hypothetical protein